MDRTPITNIKTMFLPLVSVLQPRRDDMNKSAVWSGANVDYSNERERNAVFLHYVKPVLDIVMANSASSDTLETVYVRTWKDVGRCLGVYDRKYFEKSDEDGKSAISVHADNVKYLDVLYNRHRSSTGGRSDNLAIHRKAFDAALGENRDAVEVGIVKNLMRELVKRFEMRRDGTKEKVLKSAHLCILLAMDGFSGVGPSDAQNYLSNLMVGVHEKKGHHASGVRNVYQSTLFPQNLNGTDAVHLVRIVLLRSFRRMTSDIDILDKIDAVTTESRDCLIASAREYPEILEVFESDSHLSSLQDTYERSVSDLEVVAGEKLRFLHPESSNSSNNNNKKKKKRRRSPPKQGVNDTRKIQVSDEVARKKNWEGDGEAKAKSVLDTKGKRIEATPDGQDFFPGSSEGEQSH